jgi:hypothetical protein
MRENNKTRLWVRALLGSAVLAAPLAAKAADTLTVYGPVNRPGINYVPSLLYNYDGADYQVWVFTIAGTDHVLNAVTGVVQTSGSFTSAFNALAIDIEKNSGTGTNTKYSSNINGTMVVSGGISAGGQPIFGDVAGGTFIGFANNGGWTPDLVNNPITANVSEISQVFLNQPGLTPLNVGTFPGPTPSNYQVKTLANLDPSLENSGTVNVGAINNGTVHALGIFTGDVPPTPWVGSIPFANLVVPVGTPFNFAFGIKSQFDISSDEFTTQFQFNAPGTGVLHINNSIPSPSNLINNITLFGPAGQRGAQTIAVPNAASKAGYLQVSASNLNTDPIYFGLNITGEQDLNQLLLDLQADTSDSNLTVEFPTGDVGQILASQGDTIEVVLPAGTLVNAPDVFSYDFTQYSGNGNVNVNSVTVIPEPVGLSFLAFAGAGLCRRRRSGKSRLPSLPS